MVAWEATALPLGDTRRIRTDYSHPLNRCQVINDYDREITARTVNLLQMEIYYLVA